MAIEEAAQVEASEPESEVGAITSEPGRRIDSRPPERRDWKKWNADFDKAVMEAMGNEEESAPSQSSDESEADADAGEAPAQGSAAAGDEQGDAGGVESAQEPAWSLSDALDDPEVFKAYNALRRYKWPHKQIEQLGRDGMLALGAECSRMQADQDRYSSSKGSAKETGEATESVEPVQTGEPAGREQMLAAVAPAVQPLAKTLGLETEDETSVLAGSILDAVLSLLGPFASHVNGKLDNLEADRTEAVWSEIAARVPQLKDDSLSKRVKDRASELRATSLAADLKGVAREKALIEAAMKLEVPDLPSQSELQRQRKVAKWRDNGVANQEAVRTKPKPLTEDELFDRVLEAHEQGIPSQQIVARYGRRRS